MRARRHGLLGRLPLVCVLLAAVSQDHPLSAAPNAGAPVPNRWLLILDTAAAMQERAPASLQTLQALLGSGLQGQLRPGDTIGVWTFGEHLHAGQLPLQVWSGERRRQVATNILRFYAAQKYQHQADLDEVVPVMKRIVRESDVITVIIISDGGEDLHGTPFDPQINGVYMAWREQQQQARMPFVTVLRARRGRIISYAVSPAPWNIELPPLPAEVAVKVGRTAEPTEAAAKESANREAADKTAQVETLGRQAGSASVPVRPSAPAQPRTDSPAAPLPPPEQLPVKAALSHGEPSPPPMEVAAKSAKSAKKLESLTAGEGTEHVRPHVSNRTGMHPAGTATTPPAAGHVAEPLIPPASPHPLPSPPAQSNPSASDIARTSGGQYGGLTPPVHPTKATAATQAAGVALSRHSMPPKAVSAPLAQVSSPASRSVLWRLGFGGLLLVGGVGALAVLLRERRLRRGSNPSLITRSLDQEKR